MDKPRLFSGSSGKQEKLLPALTRGLDTAWAVTAAAVFLGAMGTALLFAGAEVADTVFRRPDVEPLASLLGGALLGFGAMNWIARRSILGGIYGKAVVAGNHWHFVVGAIVLLKHGVAVGGTAGYWLLTCAYVLGAGLFSYLLFGPAASRVSQRV